MAQELPAAKKNNQRNIQNQPCDHPRTHTGKKGRRKKEEVEKTPPLGETLLKGVRHFFPSLNNWFSKLTDPRDEKRIEYNARHLLWSGILMYMLHLKSRNQLKWETNNCALFLENLLNMAQTGEETIAHPDTLAHYLKKLSIDELQSIPQEMVKRLINMKALDYYRFKDHFLIAIDGTGHLTFKEPHCEHCLEKKMNNGEILYYHPVLEAKLVTYDGFAFSICTEFIENPEMEYIKQDCEVKAFYRLAEKLYQAFPRTQFCLLLDAIYDKQTVFDICEDNRWKYFITFKEGAMPAAYKEAEALRDLSPRNTKKLKIKNGHQYFRWITNLPYHKHNLKIIWCNETKGDEKMRFVWITNFTPNFNNVDKLANQGGRSRWKIESDFRTQKHGGYEMEHAYCKNPNAAKAFYLLMQIAHILMQLVVNSNLFKNFKKQLGTVRNFARRLAESFRNVLIPHNLTLPAQIRFNSS